MKKKDLVDGILKRNKARFLAEYFKNSSDMISKPDLPDEPSATDTKTHR